MIEPEVRDQAWIGDAVLGLYARIWTLNNAADSPLMRGELFTLFTSNQFLSATGEPTRVEAEIGRVFARAGLQGAFDYISEKLLPLFIAQWNKRSRTLRRNHISSGVLPVAPERVQGNG